MTPEEFWNLMNSQPFTPVLNRGLPGDNVTAVFKVGGFDGEVGYRYVDGRPVTFVRVHLPSGTIEAFFTLQEHTLYWTKEPTREQTILLRLNL
jgi:hypothetical protein